MMKAEYLFWAFVALAIIGPTIVLLAQLLGR